ncbi:uncharacterized protein LOC118302810 isoform X3 [Scophthalmus maximus]|nr:uncharacterized protein LOC118302810 isoform X3 [Scophthalmus maximus]
MTVPAKVTAPTGNKNPPRKPLTENDSEDTSEETSTERFDTNGFTEAKVPGNKGAESKDAVKDLGSNEVMISKAVVDNAPSQRKTAEDEGSERPMDMSRRLDQDHGSRVRTDLNSEEGTTVDTRDGNLSGRQVFRSSGHLQRKAEAMTGLNAMLTPGHSREMQDWDSLEQNNGRLAVVGNSRHTDYDETREYISSETYPIEKLPSHLSVPAKSRASW